MDFTRNYPRIERILANHRSLLVLGPRGSGKTYFLSRLVKNYRPQISVDLLDGVEFERNLRRPELLALEIESKLKGLDQPLLVFIDEVGRIPSILNEVHRLIEKHKPELFFILTSSSARKLKDESANLLAGRALQENFFPLGVEEFNFQDRPEEVLQFGTLPQSLSELEPEFRGLYLRSYVGTYITEEIQREARLRNLESFSRFLELAAVENGNLINFRKIGQAIGVADTTIKAYYQLLLDTLIAYQIPAWENGIRKQIQQASRFYLFDNGVINALTGELQTELRPATNRYGKLFESFVVQQIIQRIQKELIPLKVFHYREYSGLEVDLILQKNPHSQPLAIEIKSSSNPRLKDVINLKTFGTHFPNSRKIVICNTPRTYQEDEIYFCGLIQGLQFIKEFGEE